NALNYCGIGASESFGPEEILRVIATNMPPTHGSDSALVVLGIHDAQTLHEAGLMKRDIQQRLWELARLPVNYFAEQFVARERVAGRADADTVWRANSPDQIYVIVAGGPGPQNVYIAAKTPKTRLIQEV